jgi:hypothetical protein
MIAVEGERHRALRLNGQDHAASDEGLGGVVVAVSDGVSVIRGADGVERHTHSEVGAFLVAEAAVAGCARALRAGEPLETMADHAAANIHQALAGVWEALGQRAHQALHTTLLVGVVTEKAALIFGAGDGAWGVLLPEWAREGAYVGAGLTMNRTQTGLIAVFGCGQEEEMSKSEMVSLGARVSADKVRSQLRTLLHTKVPVDGLHITTDGIVDEDAAASMIRTRVAPRSTPSRAGAPAPEGLRRLRGGLDRHAQAPAHRHRPRAPRGDFRRRPRCKLTAPDHRRFCPHCEEVPVPAPGTLCLGKHKGRCRAKRCSCGSLIVGYPECTFCKKVLPMALQVARVKLPADEGPQGGELPELSIDVLVDVPTGNIWLSSKAMDRLGRSRLRDVGTGWLVGGNAIGAAVRELGCPFPHLVGTFERAKPGHTPKNRGVVVSTSIHPKQGTWITTELTSLHSLGRRAARDGHGGAARPPRGARAPAWHPSRACRRHTTTSS